MPIESTSFQFRVAGSGTKAVGNNTIRFPINKTHRMPVTTSTTKGANKASQWNYLTGTVDTSGTTLDLTSLTHPFGTLTLSNVKGLLIINNGTRTQKTVSAGNMTSSSTTVTVILTSHGYTTGDLVDVEGASDDAYNGTFTITVSDANTFTYTALSAPSASPATGTITCAQRVELLVGNAASNPFLLNNTLGGSTPTLVQNIGPGDAFQLLTTRAGGFTVGASAKNLKLAANIATVSYSLYLLGDGTVA